MHGRTRTYAAAVEELLAAPLPVAAAGGVPSLKSFFAIATCSTPLAFVLWLASSSIRGNAKSHSKIASSGGALHNGNNHEQPVCK